MKLFKEDNLNTKVFKYSFTIGAAIGAIIALIYYLK
jgi:hypothetical protein